jgi:hypothetical protein
MCLMTIFRLALAVETPTTLTFNELSTQTLSSRFKVAPAPNQPLSFSDRLPSNNFEYRLRTPFVLSGGVSLEEPNFTIFCTSYLYRLDTT